MSITRIRAWACGLRMKQTCSVPGSTMSSVKLPFPVMSRGSSLRFTLEPNARPVGAVVDMTPPSLSGNVSRPVFRHARRNGILLQRQLVRGGLNGLDDVVVTRTAAQHAFECLADLLGIG